MKIAWFSPFSQKSAIARVSLDVTKHLAESCEVDVWVFEQDDLLETSLPVISYAPNDPVLKHLEDYDHIIYNMGNYAGYHKPIYQVLTQHQGVSILHDYLMHSFFMQIYLTSQFSDDLAEGRTAYINDMEILYGKTGREVAERSVAGNQQIWFMDEVIRYPFFEKVTGSSKAVFVHSQFHRSEIEKRFMGPVGNAYLPVGFSRHSSMDRAVVREELGIPHDRLLVVSTGIVHPVKRIHRLIETLGERREMAGRLLYCVMGQAGGPYEEQLHELIRRYGLEGSVRMLGYQPHEVMYSYLSAADFCVNLRFPNSEGCSLSLLEQMGYGNPVVVINSGFYREVPDECVLKVRANHEKEDLWDALKRLTEDFQLRERMSQTAREWVETECTLEIYCERLIDFLERLPEQIRRQQPAQQSVNRAARALGSMGFHPDQLPLLTNQLSRELSTIIHTDQSGERKQAKPPAARQTLGIWLGFEVAASLRREGITRYLLYLARHLIDNYEISCEIWCYEINYEEICISFAPLLQNSKYIEYIKVIHEKNCPTELGLEQDLFESPSEVTPVLNNLAILANRYSRAQLFLAGICYLDNLLAVERPLFVPVHDLVLHEYYHDFLAQNTQNTANLTKIRKSIEGFAWQGACIFSNSDYVRRNHVLKYVPNVKNTGFVYLPANIPEGIEAMVCNREKVCARFGIQTPYLFYPSQIRPHKNVLVLLKAMAQLIKEGFDLRLVLTGYIEHVPSVEEYIKANHLMKYLVLAHDVSEPDLYSLHKHAAVVVVPTLFEGGFPWQALEAFTMGSPVVLSRIPVVEERLMAEGFNPDTCGLALFDPYDYIDLAEKIRLVLQDCQEAVSSQKKVRDKLLSYTWDQAIHAYYNMFFGETLSLQPRKSGRN